MARRFLGCPAANSPFCTDGEVIRRRIHGLTQYGITHVLVFPSHQLQRYHSVLSNKDIYPCRVSRQLCLELHFRLSSFFHSGQRILEQLGERDPDIRTRAGGRFKVQKTVVFRPPLALFLAHDSPLVDLWGRERNKHRLRTTTTTTKCSRPSAASPV